MNSIIYDGSFKGFLTTIFAVYEYKWPDVRIFKEGLSVSSLFGESHVIITDEAKAIRVLNKLREKLSPPAFTQLFRTHLSGLAGIEDNLLCYVQYVLRSKHPVENDYSNPDVLLIQQVSRKVSREKHRMEAFVRFQLTKDGLYYAIIQPDFNVLPLISKHFKERYADQRWLIYDANRRYGIYYDLHQVSEVEMQFDIDQSNKELLATIHDQKEELYQSLWRQYFSSVNISARRNMKLHIRHMPKRYWKHLVEKLPDQRLTEDSQ